MQGSVSISPDLLLRGFILSLEAVSEDEAVFFSRLCFEPGQTVELSVAALGPRANKDRVLRIVSRSPQVREGRPGYLYRLAPVEQPETEMQHGF